MRKMLVPREFADIPDQWHFAPIRDTGEFVFFSGMGGASRVSRSASSSALVLSLLLLIGASNFVVAAPAHHGPSSQAQCVGLGLSTCPQPFDAVLPDPAYMLSWDQHTRVVGFRNTYRQYPGDLIHAQGGNVYPLPRASKVMPSLLYKMDGNTYRLKDYLQRQSVSGLLGRSQVGRRGARLVGAADWIWG
jgi:hypothetical protein